MKKLSFRLLLACVAALSMTACEKAVLDEDDNGTTEQPYTGKAYKVTVKPRAATSNSDLVYPIQLRATDKNGKFVAQQTIDNADTPINLSLSNGSYTLTAVSGSTDFAQGYTSQPLLIGSSNVTISSSNAVVNILMSYAVASIDVAFNNVPADVTGMTVTLSPQYAAISTTGEYSGNTNIDIPCTKVSSGIWTTGTKYVLPGASDNTVMSVMLTSPAGANVYSVTYPSALKAGTPYHFTGNYSGEIPSDFTLTGTLECNGWSSDVSGDFSFGPSGANSFSTPVIDAGSQDIQVTSRPEAGSIWNGHVVAYVDGNDALLLSLKDWDSLTSALYEADPNVAMNIAKSYTEGDITGWAIPTSDEARLLKALWNSTTMSKLNDAITSINGDEVKLYVNDSNARYLCENALYTFTFVTGGSVIAAGTKVKNYRLRLVKHVHFVLN